MPQWNMTIKQYPGIHSTGCQPTELIIHISSVIKIYKFLYILINNIMIIFSDNIYPSIFFF